MADKKDLVITSANMPAAEAGVKAISFDTDTDLELAATDTEGTVYDSYVTVIRENTGALAANRIVFSSVLRDGHGEIYVMSANGLTNLTNNTFFDTDPAWSPDGSKIAFMSSRGEPGSFDFEIYVMSADGSGQTQLTDTAETSFQPAWSPDGSKIAFSSKRDGNFQIYVMHADGSGQTRLTNNPAFDFGAAWSPDGSQIAFDSDRDGNHEVYVMNADGSGQTNLTNNPASDHDPDWQPLPPPVGGVAELPEVAGAPLETSGSAGPGAAVLAGVAAGIAAGAVALGGAAWWARRSLVSRR